MPWVNPPSWFHAVRFPPAELRFYFLTKPVSWRKQEQIDPFFMSPVETRPALHDASRTLRRTRMFTASPRLSALAYGDSAHVLVNRGGCDSGFRWRGGCRQQQSWASQSLLFFGPRRRNLVLLFSFISHFLGVGESRNKKDPWRLKSFDIHECLDSSGLPSQ